MDRHESVARISASTQRMEAHIAQMPDGPSKVVLQDLMNQQKTLLWIISGLLAEIDQADEAFLAVTTPSLN